MSTNIEIGDEYTTMPGSTFRKTWEVSDIEDGEVTLSLVDQAVGYEYATEDVTLEASEEKLANSIEDGVITADIVKRPPHWEMELV